MLKICDGRCLARRDFLTIGTLGLGGLSLSSLLAAAERPRHVTGKSVIFLFQQGGPSQFETFDPKPDAPEGIRTLTGTVPTTLPGVRFGTPLGQLARVAHKLTIVRSFQTNNAAHNIQPIVSPDTLQANIGSLFSRVVGAMRPDSGMPTNTVLFPQAASTEVTPGSARGDIAATGSLGAVYAPFIPGADGALQRNMRLNLARERFDDRRALLAEFTRVQSLRERAADNLSVDRFQDQAYQLLLSNRVADALDLTREDPRLVARYDTSRYARADGWASAARGRRGYYSGHARSLGKLLLLARRLCEAGCGFVTIHADYEGVWDMHADGNNLNMVDGMEAVGRSFDHAVAAFVADVEARGLENDVLLVCCGEMGRTPRVNRNGGRDHWPKLAPLVCYGAGCRPGQVIGHSTRDGGEPATENLTPKHLISTILRTVFDAGQLRLIPELNQVSRLADHPAIPGMAQ
jgi:uncharacterized protein (DUF1501 family)